MNFLLDTNAFYYFYGREKLGLGKDPKVNVPRLNSILADQDNTNSLSTITIIEFMVFNREKPDLIKSLLHFLVLKRINIIPLGILEFTYDDISKLLKLSEAALKIKSKDYLKIKINTEAGLATSSLLILLKIYVNFYLEREERNNPQFMALSERERDKRKSELFGFLLSNDIQDSLRIFHSAFTKALRQGYALGKEEKYIKDVFNNILYLNCATYSCFIEFFIKNYDTMEFTEEQLRNEYQEIAARNSDFSIIKTTPDHISKGIKQIIEEFEKETASGFIDKHRQDIVDNWKNGNMFSSRQAEYIGKLFAKWYQRGSKYEKNDMLDMLILRALDIVDNFVLITFDKSMMQFISEIGHKSARYINLLFETGS